MGIYSSLIKNIFYPIWLLKDGNFDQKKYLHKYDYLNTMSFSNIQKLQQKKLQLVLSHAHKNTTYYRNLFNETGLSPDDPEFLSKFKLLPYLTKAVVKDNFKDLTANNITKDKMILASTGGSTGKPMKFYRDKKCLRMRKGQELFYDRWYGYEIGMKAALFVAASHFDSVKNRIKAAIRNATCERLIKFNPYDISDDYMESFLSDFNRYKPTCIKSFPNSLYVFADYIKRKKAKVHSVASITCTGENLYDSQRELFRDIFSADVYEKYGTKECGIIAAECRAHDGMHIFTEGVFVEILDDKGNDVKPGEMGHLIVTDLMNSAMPLIRYKIGDMALAGDNTLCACGCQLPKIKKLLGRDRDILIDSNGNPKPGYLFVEAVNELNIDAQFQVIQTSKDKVVVKVVSEDTKLDLSKLIKKYNQYLGDNVDIEFQFVSKLERDPSGKYRYVISEIN